MNTEINIPQGSLHMILSTGYNNVVDVDGQMPFTSIEDTLARLNDYQPTGPVLMGYNTFLKLGAVPDRTNYVMRHVKSSENDRSINSKNTIALSTIKMFFQEIRNIEEPITILGGVKMFNTFADLYFIHHFRIYLHHESVKEKYVADPNGKTSINNQLRKPHSKMKCFDWQKLARNEHFVCTRETPYDQYTILEFTNRRCL